MDATAVMQRTAAAARERSAKARTRRLLDAVADAESAEPMSAKEAIEKLVEDK
jgi:hypothetical protein